MSNVVATTPEGLFGQGDGRRFSPLYAVVRHLCDFLKWRFSQLPPGAYRFDPETDDSPEQKNSEIWIGADTPVNVEVVGKRPAISISRTQAAGQGLGLGGSLAFHELHTGAKARMDLYPTNIVINCLSKLPEEAETIAWFVHEQVSSFRDEIIKTLPELLYIGGQAMFPPAMPAGTLTSGSDVDWMVVPLSYPTYLQYAIHRYPLNQRILRGANTTITPTAPTPPTQPVVPLQGTAVMQPQTTTPGGTTTSGTPDLPQE